MELSELRDLVLVILGFLGIGAAVLFLVLTLMLYRKIAPILNSARKTAANVHDASSFIAHNVVGPVGWCYGLISGVGKVAEFLAGSRRKEGKRNG